MVENKQPRIITISAKILYMLILAFSQEVINTQERGLKASSNLQAKEK